MFKKPLADLKTSAPLRGSDRRKIKQRVIETYSLLPEVGELLVPDVLLSQKFTTHVDEHGVVYLSQAGDPLWFTIGKGAGLGELIPTVYTLWKHPSLLPFLSTPAAVVPKLIGGADLMIPGVIQHTPSVVVNQLVSITQYHPGSKIGPPLAVGQMAVPSEQLAEGGGKKGKAVIVLHAWKDWLWEMGSGKKAEVPEAREVQVVDVNETGADAEEPQEAAQLEIGGAEDIQPVADVEASQDGGVEDAVAPANGQPAQKDSPQATLSAEAVSTMFRSSLLQSLTGSLKSLPTSTFPISASAFWTTHILPARPVVVIGPDGPMDASNIDIKQSTFKSVKAFLKACAKEGLIKLKESKGDVLITAVVPNHPAALAHTPYRTLGSAEEKREKAGERERKEREEEEKKKGEIQIAELWKPFGSSTPFFAAAGKSTSELYTLPQIKETVIAYVTGKGLVNARDQQYINVSQDRVLAEAVRASKNEEAPEFLKREETMKRIKENMQSWHKVGVLDGETLLRKGPVRPVSVVVKMRQGRKAATLVSGFESFFLSADEVSEELRKICAGSTSVSPLPGKASADMEVMVQGQQIQAVTKFLISKGVPKKWIESADMTQTKKK